MAGRLDLPAEGKVTVEEPELITIDDDDIADVEILDQEEHKPEVVLVEDEEASREEFVPVGDNDGVVETRTTIFVNYLDAGLTTDDLIFIFSDCGPIVEAKIFTHKVTGYSKSCGLVRFSDPDDAERAIRLKNGMGLRDKKLFVNFHLDGVEAGWTCLYVSNAGPSITEDRLRAAFQPFGHVLSVKVLTDDAGEPVGSGFVRFRTRESARAAFKSVPGRILDGLDRPLSVRYSDPVNEKKNRIYNGLMDRIKSRQSGPARLTVHDRLGRRPAKNRLGKSVKARLG